MSKKLAIVGIGPGAREFVHPLAWRLIEASDLLIGGRRQLALFAELHKETWEISHNLGETCEYIRRRIAEKNISVLVTGDPGLYSLSDYLKKQGITDLAGVGIEVIPGISSLQYLCSKRQLSWHDMRMLSMHGREEPDWLEVVRANSRVAIFTGGATRPEELGRQLLKGGLPELIVTVGENLTYPDERIVTGTPEEISRLSFASLTLMIVEHAKALEPGGHCQEYTKSGIPDEAFIRGQIPMTKEEVRAIALTKLRLKEDSLVYDIGAGTGSVTTACAVCCKRGKVYAVESDNEAVDLINRNIRQFDLHNVEVIQGTAPAVLAEYPAPDRVFIGGSGTHMAGILEWIKGFNKAIRVVINTITIESTYEALQGLEQKGFANPEFVQVAISRSRLAGTKHMLQALNPVFIISAESVPGLTEVSMEKEVDA